MTSPLRPALSAATPTPGSPERAAVREMFDRIAPRYDLLNRLLSAGSDVGWRRRAVDALELPAPLRVLDLCTGTADMLVETLRRDERNTGVGVDLSRQMLLRGRCKLGAAGSRARLAAADVQRLPLAGGVFDGALVAFGIRNVGEPLAAIREVHRVLRSGGRFVVLELGVPRGPSGALLRAYLRLLPFLGRLLSDGPAYAYLPASVARFPAGEEFAALLRAGGFENVRCRALLGGIAWLYRGDKR